MWIRKEIDDEEEKHKEEKKTWLFIKVFCASCLSVRSLFDISTSNVVV